MQTLAETFWALLTDPNIAYLLLVTGVWCVVLAVSIPGTGLPEALAVICLALAAVGLTRLPVSFAGLGLIGLALVLFVLEFRLFAHGALLLGGTIALGAGSLLLFQTQRGEAVLSWGMVAVVTLTSSGFFAWLVSRGLAAQRLPVAQDLNRVVGARGVARTAVDGEGTVYVAGENWSASAEASIPAGSPVVVVSRDGLRLKVARIDRSQSHS